MFIRPFQLDLYTGNPEIMVKITNTFTKYVFRVSFLKKYYKMSDRQIYC